MYDEGFIQEKFRAKDYEVVDIPHDRPARTWRHSVAFRIHRTGLR